MSSDEIDLKCTILITLFVKPNDLLSNNCKILLQMLIIKPINLSN